MDFANLPYEDFEALREAKRRLEYPSLTARISDLIGKPVDQLMKYLPDGIHKQIGIFTTDALMKGLEISQKTFEKGAARAAAAPAHRSHNNLHKLAVGLSGGVSGAFGLASIPVELPLSTLMILRSIMDIAKSEGHDINSAEVKMACMEVFALGGYSAKDNAAESGYWMVRAALAKEVSDAIVFLSSRAGSNALSKTPPAIVRLISAIASRFSVQVSEQAAAKAIPVVGIVTGSAINVMFMNHFQSIARGHFIIKRLEKKYGKALVEKMYGQCPK